MSTAATEASESIFTSLQNNVSSQQSRHSKSASVSEFNVEKLDETEGAAHESNGSSVSNKDGGVQSSTGSGSKSKPAPADGRKEVIEQFEPGVYVTLIQLGNGTKIFKRVKFRYINLLIFVLFQSLLDAHMNSKLDITYNQYLCQIYINMTPKTYFRNDFKEPTCTLAIRD